jgi:hypothetical protein
VQFYGRQKRISPEMGLMEVASTWLGSPLTCLAVEKA